VRTANKFRGAPPPAAPSTKDCPFCCTAIPIPATRCPHCTSQLSE
jgi:large conductance mechanosensitive channel